MKFRWCASYYHGYLHLLSTFPMVVCGVTTVSAETLASNSSWLKRYWLVNMVLDDTLSRRIYSFIGNILKSATRKKIKQKSIFLFRCPPYWVDSNCSYYQRLYASDKYCMILFIHIWEINEQNGLGWHEWCTVASLTLNTAIVRGSYATPTHFVH